MILSMTSTMKPLLLVTDTLHPRFAAAQALCMLRLANAATFSGCRHEARMTKYMQWSPLWTCSVSRQSASDVMLAVKDVLL